MRDWSRLPKCPKCRTSMYPFYQGHQCLDCGFQKPGRCVDCSKLLENLRDLRCPKCKDKRAAKVKAWQKERTPPKPKRQSATPVNLRDVCESAKELIRIQKEDQT